MEKRVLSFDDVQALAAAELPERETPATVVMNCVAVCVGSISISNVNVQVAAQICAVARVLATILGKTVGGGTQTLTCSLSL